MADKKDNPYRFAGKLGVESGPVPLQRWNTSTIAKTAKTRPPGVKRPESPRKGGGTK